MQDFRQLDFSKDGKFIENKIFTREQVLKIGKDPQKANMFYLIAKKSFFNLKLITYFFLVISRKQMK